MPVKRLSITFFVLLPLVWLVACEEAFTEPTPIPPPPTTSVSGEDTAVTNPAPIATESPTETTLEPTPTLMPTATTTVIEVSAGETDPPTQVISSPPLPATSRDLLFLADGAFKQWNHTTRQIETIVPGPDPAVRLGEPESSIGHFIGDVTGYSMSADGKRAVVARLLSTETITHTIGEGLEPSSEEITSGYELLFVDMISREVWTLVPEIKYLEEFQLSPDAQQLAIVTSELVIDPDPLLLYEQLSKNLFLLPTGGGNPGNLRQVYACRVFCDPLVWHGESNLLAFADGEALWLYNIAANAPEQLLENRLPDLAATPTPPGLFYTPISWAGNGRYLLLSRGTLEGSSRIVLDVPTGTLAAEVDALATGDPPAEVSWMSDGRLFVVRTQFEPRPITPIAEIWRFDLDAGQLRLEEFIPLSDQPMMATGATYLEDGRFAFALDISPDTFNEPPAVEAAIGTYLLTSLSSTPERVNSLPLHSATSLSLPSVNWAKDGSGALLLKDGSIYYAPASGEFLYEITAVLGQDPHDFQWQPEIIVP